MLSCGQRNEDILTQTDTCHTDNITTHSNFHLLREICSVDIIQYWDFQQQSSRAIMVLNDDKGILTDVMKCNDEYL